MKRNNSNIFTKLAKDLAKELSANVEEAFDFLKDNKNTSTTNTLPQFKLNCNAPKLDETTAVKLQTQIPSNNFSVCLFDDTIVNKNNNSISYFENFNIIEVYYSTNNNTILLTIEDTVNRNNQPLEIILKQILHFNIENLTLSVDLFNKQSELVRTFIFNNVSLESYNLTNPLKLFNSDNNTNTLKYNVLFSFDDYNIY